MTGKNDAIILVIVMILVVLSSGCTIKIETSNNHNNSISTTFEPQYSSLSSYYTTTTTKSIIVLVPKNVLSGSIVRKFFGGTINRSGYPEYIFEEALFIDNYNTITRFHRTVITNINDSTAKIWFIDESTIGDTLLFNAQYASCVNITNCKNMFSSYSGAASPAMSGMNLWDALRISFGSVSWGGVYANFYITSDNNTYLYGIYTGGPWLHAEFTALVPITKGTDGKYTMFPTNDYPGVITIFGTRDYFATGGTRNENIGVQYYVAENSTFIGSEWVSLANVDEYETITAYPLSQNITPPIWYTESMSSIR